MLAKILNRSCAKYFFEKDKDYMELLYLAGEKQLNATYSEINSELEEALENIGKGTESDRFAKASVNLVKLIDRKMAEAYNEGRKDRDDVQVADSVK